jgi:hypothetical protein
MLHVISRYAKRDDLPRRALHRCPFRAPQDVGDKRMTFNFGLNLKVMLAM